MTQLRLKTKKLFNKKFYNFLEKTKHIDWDWKSFRFNPSLPLQFVIDNPNIEWSPDFFDKKYKLKFVSFHCGLDLSLIKNNPKFDWDWNYINDYTLIDFNDIKELNNKNLLSGLFKPYDSPVANTKPRRKFDLNSIINQDLIELDFDYLCQDSMPIVNQEFETYLFTELESIKKQNLSSIIRYYEKEKHGTIFHMKLLNHESIYVNFNYVYNLISNNTLTQEIVNILSKNIFIMEYYLILIEQATLIIQKWFRKILLSPYTKLGKRFLELKYDTFKLLNC